MIMRRMRRAALVLAVTMATGGALALAPGVAQAQTPNCTGSSPGGPGGEGCAGTVNDSITIPVSFAFTLTTQSITFTGTVGSNSNAPTVAYSVTTNDPSGYTVTVGGTDLTGATHGGDIPAGDISLWGPKQAQPSSNIGQASPVFKYWPVSLSGTPQTVASSSGQSVGSSNGPNGVSVGTNPGAADTWTDTYAFLGTAGGFTDSTGGAIGSNIPSVTPDTYNGTLSYLALPS